MGKPLTGQEPLERQAVIRIGRTLFVFHEHGGPLLDPPPSDRFGMAGRFHVGPTIRLLREAALSSRHCLVTGPSGTGKEIAARALAEMMETRGQNCRIIISHNAARFASEEEAATTLFGVGPRVFSGVDSRPGLIEEAQGGVLFLDEAHCLPERIQKSLLRLIEENRTARIGDTLERPADIRVVMGSNREAPSYGLARDLLARLRIVPIPPISERIADIPTIFDHWLQKILDKLSLKIEDVKPEIKARHYESMVIDGFKKDNIRGLIDLADKIATRIGAGSMAKEAVESVFAERFERQAGKSNPPSEKEHTASHYHRHKARIVAVYEACNYNLSATERDLLAEGFQCSRRWIRHYLKQWAVYRAR